MAERSFYAVARLAPDGTPVVHAYIPAGPGEPHFQLVMGPLSVRQMAAALVETADIAEKLATVTPTGTPN